MRSFLFLLGAALAVLPLEAVTVHQQKMLRDLDCLALAFDVNYALKDWKKERFDWDLDEQVNQTKQKILADDAITIKAFQQLIASFCHSAKDYHVDISFVSTESAHLPFSIRGADGLYFISEVEEDNLPFRVGDQVVSFDGVPIAIALKQLETEFGYCNHSPTDKRIAEYYLTFRDGSSGHVVPQGDVSLSIRSKNGSVKAYLLEWNYSPEMISNHVELNPSTEAKELEWRVPLANRKTKKASLLCGNKKSFVPPLGKETWRSWAWSKFNARVYKVDSLNVGYMRIPDYSSADATTVEDFRQLIATLEKKSDVLVIDQLENPGGNPLYLFTLLTMLTEKPLILPTEQVLLSKQHIGDCFEAIERFQANPNDGIWGFRKELKYYPHREQAIQDLYNYQVNLMHEWREGRILSNPIPFVGFESILPHSQTRYTKPMIVLIDELDFSCADLLPAILQDNGRATIFGARTGGAGGCQMSYELPNHYGIESIQLTHSLFHRPNGNFIENEGVTPDVIYKISAEDLKNGYKPYRNALNKAIKQLMQD